MKHAFLLLVLSGCPTSGGTGTLTATWSLKNSDGSPGACASGYDTMKISANAWDKSFEAPDPGGTPFVGLFDCAAGTGTLELPLDGTVDDTTEIYGKYDVQWSETDSTGGTTVAVDLQSQLYRSVSVDVSGGSASATATMYQDGGYGWFDWNLYGSQVMDHLDSCAGAGVDTIDVELTEQTTMVVSHLSFPCSNSTYTADGAMGVEVDDLYALGAGIAPLPAGDYDYVMRAYAGTTVVGEQNGVEDLTVEKNNHIGISAYGASIVLTNR